MKKLLLILLCLPMIGFGQERVHICDLNKYSNRGSKFYLDPYRVNYQKLCNNDTINLALNFRIVDTLIVHHNNNWWKDNNNYFDGIIYDNFENGELWWELEYIHGFASKYTEWFENKKKKIIVNMVNWDHFEAAGEAIESFKLFINGKETFEADKIASGYNTHNRLDKLQERFFKRGFNSHYNINRRNRNLSYKQARTNYVKKPTPVQIVIHDPIHPKRFLYIPYWAKKLTHKGYNHNTYSEIELDSINFLNQISFIKRQQDSVRQLFKEKEFIKAYKRIEKGRKIKPKIKDAIALIDKYNNELEVINSEIFHISIQLRTLRKNGCFIYKIDEQVYLDSTVNKFYFIENNREVPINKYTISSVLAGDIAFEKEEDLEEIPEHTTSTFFYKDINIDSSTYTRNWYDKNAFLEQQEGLSNGQYHGKQKRWDNGQLYSEENYVNGQQHGKQKSWDNGQLQYEANYVNGQRHGKAKNWSEDGQLSSEANYVNGQQHGKQKRWDNGPLSSEENYVNGQYHGKQESWDNGQLSSEANYVNGQYHGKQKRWHNGQLYSEENYVNGQYHGKQKSWDNGQLQYEANYVNGQQHGKQKRWDNGQLSSESNYVNGQRHGKAKNWSEDGQLTSESNYVNGQQHGKEKYWYENGQLISEYNYVNGQKHGKQKDWGDGQLISEENYVNGQKHGKQKDWRDGQLISEENYVNGEEVYEKSSNSINSCLVGYDWCQPNCSDATAAWKFSSDGTFSYSTTMFGGMSAWGTWEDVGDKDIKIVYTRTSTGDIFPDKTISMPDCKSLKIGQSIYKR